MDSVIIRYHVFDMSPLSPLVEPSLSDLMNYQQRDFLKV